jgi:GLPGLI family protein
MKLKSSSFLLVLLICSSSLWAQQLNQGVITFEVTIDLHRNLPADRQELRSMIPQYRTDNFQLFFTENATLYKMREEEEPVSGRGGGRMRMGIPRIEAHTDRNSQERTVALDMMGRNYLILDTIDILPWKFGNEQMEIAGYMCMMAWYIDTVTQQEITAWFSPQLPAFMGPDRYSTLPGTVLAVDINNGERVWVARQIEAKEVKPAEIRKPNRGERISRADFNKMMEEMMQRFNPGGTPFRF